MFGSSIIEVAIGMIFVYLLLSLICSAVNEIIESKLKNRATDLERGIRELFNDVKGDGIVKDFYNHALIRGLYGGIYNRKIKALTNYDYVSPSNLPSYIPAGNFAFAVMDILLHPKVDPAPTDKKNELSDENTTKKENEELIDKNIAQKEPAPENITEKEAAPENITEKETAPVIITEKVTAPVTITEKVTAPVNPDDPGTSWVNPYTNTISMESIRFAIDRNVKDKRVQEALRTIVEQSGGDINLVRQNIEAWFNSSMDRVSGWYTRRTKLIILAIGLVVTIFLNVNTITIAKRLSSDATLRNVVVAQAEAYAKRPEAQEADFNKNRSELESLGIPLGWNGYKFFLFGEINPFKHIWDDILLHLIGWLLTVAAISQGAPFWFDLLNKFMVIRSTVKPHEKSPEESSEDNQKLQPSTNTLSSASETQTLGSESAAMQETFQPREWSEGNPQEGIV